MNRGRKSARVAPGGAARNVARYVAPAAFLLAVTGVVLLVRTSLRSDTPATRTATAVATAPLVVTPRPATSPSVPKRYYVIAAGDTLDGIASRFSTTVDALLRLNPGIEPTALTPGEQLRVK